MSLYNPSHFRAENWREVVSRFPLATLIVGDTISHLPLLLEERGDKTFLVGHLARANPQSKILDGADCAIVFHGPNAYISPLWYEECDVPTWNYVVVHMHGRAKASGEESTEAALRKFSDLMEGKNGWEFQIPVDLTHSLHRAILGFEIEVRQVEAKFKLSQNRSERDRKGVKEGLRQRGDARSQEVADWMEKA
jgi:transcriptional regulator